MVIKQKITTLKATSVKQFLEKRNPLNRKVVFAQKINYENGRLCEY